MSLKDGLRDFPELSYHAFQHPLDSQATASLKSVPGLPRAMKLLSEKSLEVGMHLQNVSCNLQVNAQQYPSLYRQYVRMAQVLDVRKLPSLYIQTSDTINAYAMGMENYSIVLCSGLIDIMEEDELLAIIGHELGHVKCEHQLYKSVAFILTNFGSAVLAQAIPLLGNVINMSFQMALLEWNRRAELSCDRAALLATQDAEAVSRALAKLAGFTRRFPDELNIEAVVQQANNYQEYGADSMLTKLMKLRTLSAQTHPYPVVRVKEIVQWAQSAEYRQILEGNYRRAQAVTAGNGWQGVQANTPRGVECPGQKCKYPCDEDALFCVNCATNLRGARLICGRCRAGVDDDWLICITCGNRLHHEASEQLEAAVPPSALLQP